MKKFLLWQVLAVLFTVFGANAQEPSFNWAKLIDGKGSDGAYTLAKAADGDVFIATNFASKGEDLSVSYGDEVVATGAPNTATSGNRNMLLQKIKADGNYEWNAYTNMGDVASAQLTATADGGVLVAIKARYTNRNEDGTNRLLSYVAPDGTQTDIKMDNPVLPGWIYQGILLKVSDSGELLWSKILRFDYPTVDDKMVTDGFELNAAAVDAEGNIYLGGNFSVTATFDKADGETATVEPQYTGDLGNGLTGDGGLLLAKFDSEGNYLKHFSTTGKAVKENVFGLEFDGGQLYALVQLKGTGSDAVEFGGKAIEPTAFDDVVVIVPDYRPHGDHRSGGGEVLSVVGGDSRDVVQGDQPLPTGYRIVVSAFRILHDDSHDPAVVCTRRHPGHLGDPEDVHVAEASDIVLGSVKQHMATEAVMDPQYSGGDGLPADYVRERVVHERPVGGASEVCERLVQHPPGICGQGTTPLDLDPRVQRFGDIPLQSQLAFDDVAADLPEQEPEV